jgi:hypothetical protein
LTDVNNTGKIAAFDFDMIAPCHGEPVNVDAKRLLAQHLGYDTLETN